MKKMYNQPEIQVSEMEPKSVLCASVTKGGNTGDPENPDVMYTD